MYNKTNIKDIRELICENGFKDNKKSDSSVPVNEERITEARDWIQLKLSSTKKINRRAERSYALKKKIEKYLKKLHGDKEISSVSNGDIIVAMWEEGYHVEQDKPFGVNAYFNISINRR